MSTTTSDETNQSTNTANQRTAALHHHPNNTPIGAGIFLDRHQLEALNIDTTADAISYHVDGNQLIIDDKS